MIKLPDSQTGIVLGSGCNTSKWRQKGWETIDIFDKVEPNYVGDVNNLAKIVGDKKFDFVLSENLTLNSEAGHLVKTVHDYYEPAVEHENLIIQSSSVLKKNGKLIIDTADFGDKSVSLPTSEEFSKLIIKHGFDPIMEIPNLEDFLNSNRREKGIKVIWYAEKR